MPLPLKSPIAPQLARSGKELPLGEQWAYEPKFDGFRAIAFVDGQKTLLQSRGAKPLDRYFPEISFPPGRYIVDGEIVIDADSDPTHPTQDFGALQQRIHPAASRIAMLAEQTPARYVAFDLLARDDESLLALPFAERRAALEELTAGGIDLTPLTRDPDDTAPMVRPRRGRRGQGPAGGLPSGGAQGHGQGQARAHDRRGGRRLPAGQGARHGRVADPRALRRRRRTARRRTLLGPEGGREAEARRRRFSPTRPASAVTEIRAGGSPSASWSGSRCAPSSSSR